MKKHASSPRLTKAAVATRPARLMRLPAGMRMPPSLEPPEPPEPRVGHGCDVIDIATAGGPHLANLRRAGRPDEAVAASVAAIARPLIESMDGAYDLVFVILRGGDLLTSALERAGHAVIGIRPCSLALPSLQGSARRILLCDTMADTGATFLDLTRRIAARYPDARIELLTAFSTDAAIERLRPRVAAFHNAHRIARGAFFQAPMDIPYDFGQVAENIGLGGVRRARGARPIAGVIFDFDGTLVESAPLHFQVDRQVLASRGVTLTRELAAEFSGRCPRDYWDHVIRTFRLQGTAEELLGEGRARFLALARSSLAVLPHMRACLQWFGERKYPMSVASGSSLSLLEPILEHLGIRDRFEVVVSAEEVPHGKPAPDVFLEAAARMGLEPGELLVFEDSPAGVLAARRARMRCVAIPASADVLRASHHMADLLFETGREGFDLDLLVEFLSDHLALDVDRHARG